VVRDGREAILHETADPRDLRDALRRIVTDAPMRLRLAAGGRERVQEYAWPTVAGTVEAHYETLLRERC
jgi:glycosyltransferase involved in cell wall biosynthesis